ncbi:hypothetical protein FQN54_001205 [Arachnomyces sp. PD_36]|nr:hypothetical protein FQN54_001205 [Arachnomyces sp. PD_36]
MADSFEDDAPFQQELTSVAEKKLPQKCSSSRTLAYCPTMDLVSLATDDGKLHAFRLNGQRVFGDFVDHHGDGGDTRVKLLTWKPNGNFLAIGCADNNIRVLSAYTGKIVHYLPRDSSPSQPINPDAKISCVGWGVNFTDSKAAQAHLQDAEGKLSVDDLLTSGTHVPKIALLKADLPRELALLDIESSLPKLSTLPTTGNDDDVFSSRASIDSIFHSQNRGTSDSVDVLLVGSDDGTIHLRIFDCFDIGSLQIGGSVGSPSFCETRLHASHPLCPTHALMVSAPTNTTSQLRLVTLDLRFITKSGRYLSLLASKTTLLQNLLRYINQIQRQIQLEWKNAHEIPGRYMRNINEDLEEKCHSDFVTAAYHLLATGDCSETLREFLVDQVGERGHKRWEKAVSTGYENVRRLTHECLLPALERCGVLLSRLIGLAKFHKLSHILGLEVRSLKDVMETVDCLNLLSHKVLIHSGREIREFSAFSRWLRHEIDLQGADPLSATMEELVEKSDTIDYSQSLSYIQGAMKRSALEDYIQPSTGHFSPPRPSSGGWDSSRSDGSFYETYKKLLQLHEQQGDKANDKVTLPLLGDLTSRLGSQCEKVFSQIAETQRRGILYRSPLVLDADCDRDAMHMTMDFEDLDGKELCHVYIVAKSRQRQSSFYLYHVALDSVNGVSSTRSIGSAMINLGSGEIRQIKFVEDDTSMLIWSSSESTYLINFPYRHDPEAAFSPLPATNEQIPSQQQKKDTRATDSPIHRDVELDLNQHPSFFRHKFAPGVEPVGLEVNGRKGRRVVCVLYGDGSRYSVFDLDSAGGEDDVEEQEEGEDGEGDGDLIMADGS